MKTHLRNTKNDENDRNGSEDGHDEGKAGSHVERVVEEVGDDEDKDKAEDDVRGGTKAHDWMVSCHL